jgi:hypothetical protein
VQGQKTQEWPSHPPGRIRTRIGVNMPVGTVAVATGLCARRGVRETEIEPSRQFEC